MKETLLKKRLAIIMAASLVTSIPAWAVDKDPQLDEQIQRYWSAQAKRDWDTMYDLLAQKQKASITRAQHSELRNNSGAFDLSNAKVKDMEIVGDLAWVAVGFDAKLIRYPNAPARHAHIWQVWQKTDTWHPVPDNERQQFQTLPPKLRVAAEETTLANRAKIAWEAKTAQDWKSYYNFLSPAYRSLVSLDDFLKKKAQYLYPSTHIDWAEVTQAKKDQGEVKVTFWITPNAPAATKLEAQ
jgi:hypothetical protein